MSRRLKLKPSPTAAAPRRERAGRKLIEAMRGCHEVCDKYGDEATASILENFIDQAERRVWFLFEASRKADDLGHEILAAIRFQTTEQCGTVCPEPPRAASLHPVSTPALDLAGYAGDPGLGPDPDIAKINWVISFL